MTGGRNLPHCSVILCYTELWHAYVRYAPATHEDRLAPIPQRSGQLAQMGLRYGEAEMAVLGHWVDFGSPRHGQAARGPSAGARAASYEDRACASESARAR